MEHQLWHLIESLSWGHGQPGALPVWSRSRIKVLPFSLFPEPLRLLLFLLRATIQTPSFTQKRTLTVNYLLNCGKASCAVFQALESETALEKLGWKLKAQCPGSPSKLLSFIFSLLLKLFFHPYVNQICLWVLESLHWFKQQCPA